MWPRWWNAAGRWLIDWELRADGHPSKSEVAAALTAHRGASRYTDQVELSTAAGEAIDWARARMRPGAAAIVDTVIRADGCLSPGRRLSANSFLRVLPKPG